MLPYPYPTYTRTETGTRYTSVKWDVQGSGPISPRASSTVGSMSTISGSATSGKSPTTVTPTSDDGFTSPLLSHRVRASKGMSRARSKFTELRARARSRLTSVNKLPKIVGDSDLHSDVSGSVYEEEQGDEGQGSWPPPMPAFHTKDHRQTIDRIANELNMFDQYVKEEKVLSDTLLQDIAEGPYRKSAPTTTAHPALGDDFLEIHGGPYSQSVPASGQYPPPSDEDDPARITSVPVSEPWYGYSDARKVEQWQEGCLSPGTAISTAAVVSLANSPPPPSLLNSPPPPSSSLYSPRSALPSPMAQYAAKHPDAPRPTVEQFRLSMHWTPGQVLDAYAAGWDIGSPEPSHSPRDFRLQALMETEEEAFEEHPGARPVRPHPAIERISGEDWGSFQDKFPRMPVRPASPTLPLSSSWPAAARPTVSSPLAPKDDVRYSDPPPPRESFPQRTTSLVMGRGLAESPDMIPGTFKSPRNSKDRQNVPPPSAFSFSSSPPYPRIQSPGGLDRIGATSVRKPRGHGHNVSDISIQSRVSDGEALKILAYTKVVKLPNGYVASAYPIYNKILNKDLRPPNYWHYPTCYLLDLDPKKKNKEADGGWF